MPNKRQKSHKRFCKKLRELKVLKRLSLSDNVENLPQSTESSAKAPETDRYQIVRDFVDSVCLKIHSHPSSMCMLTCEHTSISSALMFRFLFGKYSLIDSHQMYFTGLNRMYGRMAENFVLEQVKGIKKGFCLFSDIYPWVCATPDGILCRFNR